MSRNLSSAGLCALALLAAPLATLVWQPAQAQTAPAAKIFHGVGVVTGVTPDSGLVMISHENIDGLMDAMEMQFEVKPASLLNGVNKGDKVAFDIDGNTLTILGLRKK
jgi:Cu/Ag efflux protein CusF